MKQKRIFFTAACILAAVGAMAQGNGQAGITEATQMVTSYFEPGTKLIYAIGAVVGLIGGVKMKRYWLSSPLNSTFLPIPLLISKSIVRCFTGRTNAGW